MNSAAGVGRHSSSCLAVWRFFNETVPNGPYRVLKGRGDMRFSESEHSDMGVYVYGLATKICSSQLQAVVRAGFHVMCS